MIWKARGFVKKPFEINILDINYITIESTLNNVIHNMSLSLNNAIMPTYISHKNVYTDTIRSLLSIPTNLDNSSNNSKDINTELYQIIDKYVKEKDLILSNDIIKQLQYKFDINLIQKDVDVYELYLLSNISTYINHLIYVRSVQKTIKKIKDKISSASYIDIVNDYSLLKTMILYADLPGMISAIPIDIIYKIPRWFKSLLVDDDISFIELNLIMYLVYNIIYEKDKSDNNISMYIDNDFIDSYYRRFIEVKKKYKQRYYIDLYSESNIYNFITSCKPIYDKIEILLESEKVLKKL